MKNLKLFVFLFALIFGYTSLSAQYDPNHYDVDQNTVVAVNGLKLRTKPSLKGKVIDKIPYGTRVDILQESHFGSDTLESNYRIYYSDVDYHQPQLTGKWVKASYEGQEGYVFSAFLYYHFDNEYDYNQKMALLLEGANCYDNLHYRPDWHWYGLYPENGGHQLKKIKPDLFVEESELGPLLHITTDQMSASLFIVGSPRPLSEGRLFFSDYTGHTAYLYRGGELDEKLLRDAALEIIDTEGEDYLQLVALGSQGQRQVLNPKEAYLSYPSTLVWYGDLDGDGRMDYLINFGEKSAQTILYLSSKAKAGQLAAPVGAYFSGYCC